MRVVKLGKLQEREENYNELMQQLVDLRGGTIYIESYDKDYKCRNRYVIRNFHACFIKAGSQMAISEGPLDVSSMNLNPTKGRQNCFEIDLSQVQDVTGSYQGSFTMIMSGTRLTISFIVEK